MTLVDEEIELAPTVFVVDDDAGMRRGLEFLLKHAGLPVRGFGSAREFLDYYQPDMRGCMLLDVRMPGISGLDLQEHLRKNGTKLPVVIVTAYGSIPMAVRAMQQGAVDFIEKPFDGALLLERVHRALAHEAQVHLDAQRNVQLQERHDLLTPREREVMRLVVSGLLNKQIAAELGISMKTVENHRACVMDKMEADSLAELVKMSMALGT